MSRKLTNKGLNIHLYPSPFKNESRIEKQALSLINKGFFDGVSLFGTYEKGMEKQREFSPGIKVILVGRENTPGMISKLFTFLIYYIRVASVCWNQKIVCLNAHSLSVLPLGYLLKLLHGATLIYDTHELETETNSVRGLRKLISKWVEKTLIGKTDHIFVVSENIADWYQQTYSIPRPTVILNSPRRHSSPNSRVFREKFGIGDEQIIVLYQGNLGNGRGVNVLLSTFEKRNDDRVVIVFMGYGELETKIQQVASRSSRVFFHPAVAPNEVLDYTGSADVGISLIENTCLSYYYCMPNKLFEYAMVSLPVIVSDMKEMREFVEKYEMGLVVKGVDELAFDQAIDQLVEMDLTLLKKNARIAAEKHAWEVQEAKMLSVYKSLNFRSDN